MLIAKSLAALKLSGLRQLVVAGGVGANRELRTRLAHAAADRGFQVFYPALEFCTDNGAMIAFAAALRLKHASCLTPHASRIFSVRPRWDLSALVPVNA